MALYVSGDGDQGELYALMDDFSSELLVEGVGNDVAVSPDGRWLGYVVWHDDGGADLVLQEATSGQEQRITPETFSGMLRFAFHAGSSRLSYLDLGSYSDEGVPWALVVEELESGESARYDALMANPESRPLPGAPIGWSGQPVDGEELIIDTFLPYTEGGWMGVWGVALPVDGSSAPLDTLPTREIVPGASYSSQVLLAPDRRSVAFLGRDPDYEPDDYQPEFYDLAVNRMVTASLADGARTRLVEALDGSALARALDWAPTGERLLFAQGFYEGNYFAELSLKSSDLNGTVVTYGPLTLPSPGGLLALAWCTPSAALYVTYDSGGGVEQLLLFDLNTGVSTEITAARRLQVVGCAPEMAPQ
jgi:hypothetical protein